MEPVFSCTAGTHPSSALRPDLDVGLNYNLEVSAFTESDRLDFDQQVVASLAGELTPRQRLQMVSRLRLWGVIGRVDEDSQVPVQWASGSSKLRCSP